MMAEFKDVCKQWRRMCMAISDEAHKDGLGCKEHCKLACNPVCGDLENAVDSDFDAAEKEIMAWAAEHPEPVYATWAQWLQEMGLIKIRWNGPVLASMRSGVDDTDYIPVVKKMLEHIPADTAQKLGLEPKEV